MRVIVEGQNLRDAPDDAQPACLGYPEKRHSWVQLVQPRNTALFFYCVACLELVELQVDGR